MLFLSTGEDYHIVQVDQGISQVKLSEAILHESLKHHWSVTEPVRHSQKLIHSHTTHRKGSVLLRVFGHLDLPKARFQIHGGEEPGTYHRLRGLLHLRKGYASFLVWLFSWQKSMQNRRPPSFLCTKTTALHHGDCDSRMAPPSNISCKCSHTSSTSGGAIRWRCSLKGSISNSLITCLATSVQPISFRSSEKILWCSISIRSNFRANSGGHSFNLSNRPSF